MWFTYALLSAVFASIRRTNEKQLSHKLNHFTIGWTVQLFALPVLIATLLVTGSWLNPFSLGWQFWLPALGVILGFYPLNTYLYISALKHGELSQILPLQSLKSVFSLILGIAFLHQIPALSVVPAIGLIIAGIYILQADFRHPLQPFKVLFTHRASLLFMASILQGAIVDTVDVYAIRASNPIFYCVVSTVGAVVVLYAIARFKHVSEQVVLRQNLKSSAIAGTLFGGSFASFASALATGPVGYVAAVRSSGTIMGALTGILYFKEKLTPKKIIALALVTAGTILMATVSGS